MRGITEKQFKNKKELVEYGYEIQRVGFYSEILIAKNSSK